MQRVPVTFPHHGDEESGYDRADLDNWAAWLDEQGVPHSGVRDLTEPIPFATLVFRDPDDIQLELIHMPALTPSRTRRA